MTYTITAARWTDALKESAVASTVEAGEVAINRDRLDLWAALAAWGEPAPFIPYVPTALDEIRNLEALITPRRLREAVLTPEGKAWLEGIEAQIAALRPPRQEVLP